MCKKPKENANVIKGPWKKKSKREIIVPDVDVIALQENLMFADDLTESLLVQMIHTMGENGVDVSTKSFIKDITEVTVDDEDTAQGKVNLELIEKMSIKNDEEEESPEPA